MNTWDQVVSIRELCKVRIAQQIADADRSPEIEVLDAPVIRQSTMAT